MMLAKQKGLSLVELMVSLVIGLILTVGVMQVFISNKQTYALNDDLAMIQENARYALEFIGQDIRMAGYAGCNSNGPVANTLADVDKASAFNQFGLGISGVDGDEADFSSSGFDIPVQPTLKTGSLPKSDALFVYRAKSSSSDFKVTSHNTSSAMIHGDRPHGFSKNQILYITDCDHAAVLKVTGTHTADIQHRPGNGGNKCKGLGMSGGVACSSTPLGTAYEYKSDAIVMEASSQAYYVDDDSGIPSLYRKAIKTTTVVAEELVPGIENFQVAYGLDIDDTGVANSYINAETITDAQWLQVVSARVWLLARSINQVASKPTDFVFKNKTYTPTDRYLRKEFFMTVKLRNRGAS